MMDSPKKLVVESPLEVEPSEAQVFERRSFATYKARLVTHARLTRRNVAWNSSLVAFSTATTVASVGLLVDDQMYGRGGEALMVTLAVFSLVVSLVVSNVNYGSRAKAMEASYKHIQRISLAAERVKNNWIANGQKISEITRDYEVAIETSENHSDVDHFRTLENLTKSQRVRMFADSFVTVSPYVSLIAPILILVPFVQWFARGF